MDKISAAQFLNISPRTLQRHTSQGKISVKYKQGRTGAEADYDAEELGRFKEAQENTTYQPANTPIQRTASLATFNNGARTTIDKEQLSMVLAAIRPALQPATHRTTVPVESKLLLKLDEASALTGLSRATLRNAIEQKKLKAQIIGRAWRMKRSDVEAYIQKL